MYETSVTEYNDSSGHREGTKHTLACTMGFSVFYKVKGMSFLSPNPNCLENWSILISKSPNIFLWVFIKIEIDILKILMNLFFITKVLSSTIFKSAFKKWIHIWECNLSGFVFITNNYTRKQQERAKETVLKKTVSLSQVSHRSLFRHWFVQGEQ